MDNDGVCVLLVRATAAESGDAHRAGERYAIMGFLTADSFDIAEAQLTHILTKRGWRDFELAKAEMIGFGAGADDAVRNASSGRVVIHVFPDPVELSG